jgi:hypothetical protein
MAPNGHADPVERCPLLEEKQNTSALSEYFAFWAAEAGLEQYEATFRENEISEKVLPNLTAEDLKDLGVGMVGHRRMLRRYCGSACSSERTNACACRKSNPNIFVVQSAEDWAAKNAPCPLHGAR